MISKRYPWLEKYINRNPVSQFPSSLIIEGEGGLGKTALAKYFAKKLLCEDESRPCGNCSSCSYFDAGSHPDYCFLLLMSLPPVYWLHLNQRMIHSSLKKLKESEH